MKKLILTLVALVMGTSAFAGPVFGPSIKKDDTKSGVNMISLVDQPAIEVDWLAFSEQKKLQFAQVSKDKQLLAAPFLIPNKMIYRKDGINEYFVVFELEPNY